MNELPGQTSYIYIDPKHWEIITSQLRREHIIMQIIDQTPTGAVWKNMELKISQTIQELAKNYPKNRIEKTIWWIEVARMEDLLDEHATNHKKYNLLMIEAKISLVELLEWDAKRYAERYSKYIEIIRQMHELLVINSAIDRQSDPPSFV